MTWLSPFFIHPAMAALGAALIAVPILIHLINRLQYRKVRFAAMEFLLQSQQRNRRRILFEQLLLLLLRILIVLLLAILFARLILDPSQLAMLERPETHHVLVLDDSGSMQDRWGETSAYQEGLGVIKQLVGQLANLEGLQTCTLLQISQPDRSAANFTRRQVDFSLISELEDKLETMQGECGYGRPNWSDTFAALKRIISADPGQQKVIHVISDFRVGEWKQSTSLKADLEGLADDNTQINLIPAVPGRHENLAVTSLQGELHTAAVRVPLRLTTQITNYGENLADNVTVRVLVDGEPIPQSLNIPTIEAGDTVQQSFEVTLTTPGEHAIAVQIPADALANDNIRYLTLNVPDKQRVLIADGSEQFSEAQFVADALSADAGITGIEVIIVRPEDLREQDLSLCSTIYLINVPELPPDTLSALEEYVSQGGGLAWFLGDRINGEFYRRLSTGKNAEKSLFPVSIGQSPATLARPDETNPGADLELTNHPLFEFFNAADGLLAHYLSVYRYYPLAQEVENALANSVQIIGRLRNQAPLFLESKLGQGRIFISLTSAGPMANLAVERWHNWPLDINSPGFTVFHLELVKYLGSRQGLRSNYQISEPLQITVNSSLFLPEVRFDPPQDSGLSAVTVQATPVITPKTGNAPASSPDKNPVAGSSSEILQATFQETRRPGVYRVTREDLAREANTEWYAFNVPPEEGQLELTTPPELRNLTADLPHVLVQDFGELQGLQRQDSGKELRTLLLLLLVVFLVGEQALAYRLSFHSRGNSSALNRAGSAGFVRPRDLTANREEDRSSLASGGRT